MRLFRTAVLLCAMLVLTCATALAASVTINSTNFPDANFREYISSEFDQDGNGALSAAELAAVTDINVEESEIANLKGIEHFTSLTVLDCSWNDLTSLDISKNTLLEELNCEQNSLTALNVSKCTALRFLYCGDNSIKTLDVSKCASLIELSCDFNSLTSLDVSTCTSLEVLNCEANKLTALNLKSSGALTWLACGFNSLSALDLSACKSLVELYCQDAGITKLDVSAASGLEILYVYGNSFARLDVSSCPNLVRCANEGDIEIGVTEYDEDGNASYSSTVYSLMDEDDVDLYYELRLPTTTVLGKDGMSTPDFTLPAGLTAIEAEAFSGARMTVVLCPSGLKTIASKAFANCTALKQIYIPATVTSIASDAFSGCSGLTIYGASGSAAATFAASKGFDFVVYTP